MDNKALGRMIIKVERNKKNNTNVVKIILIEKNQQYIHPTEELTKVHIQHNTKIYQNKYYKGLYYNISENKLSGKSLKELGNIINAQNSKYVIKELEPLKEIKITENFEEYIKTGTICWNDTNDNIVYAPYNDTKQQKYCKGWKKEDWMRFTDSYDGNDFFFMLPDAEPTKIKDLMNDSEVIDYLIENLKNYTPETANEISKLIKTEVIKHTNIHRLRWEKSLSIINNIAINAEQLLELSKNDIFKKNIHIAVQNNLEHFIDMKRQEINNKTQQLQEDINKISNILQMEQKKLQILQREKDTIEQELQTLYDQKFAIENISGNDYIPKAFDYKCKKCDNIKTANEEYLGLSCKRLIIQPNPKWLTFQDLWSSGFGVMFESAHKLNHLLHIVIIQNYNLSIPDCWVSPIVNIVRNNTTQVPYSIHSGYPENLKIYFIPIIIDDISMPESQYFSEIFKENE